MKRYSISSVRQMEYSKQEAWDKWYEEYCNTDGAEECSICSHNSFSLPVMVYTDGMRLETSYNSYLVVFDE